MANAFLPQLQTLVVPLVVLPGLFLAALLLRLRRARLRTRRRSPLTSELLRSPGEHLREQVEQLQEKTGEASTFLFVVPLIVLAVHLAQSYLTGTPESAFRLGFTSLAIIGAVAFYTVQLLRLSRERDQLQLGLDAEMAIGQELDQLMRDGAAVFHDFPADKFNIDHVVICPSGVYAVETKGRAKPIDKGGIKDATVEFDGKSLRFPGWTESDPITQAERQSQWLQRWLTSAIGEAVSVRPVLALPGWFIERKARSRVFIFNGRNPQFLLKLAPESTPLSKQSVQRIAHQVEQRCRNVSPGFNKDSRSKLR